jgi:uncharacterized membrane protein
MKLKVKYTKFQIVLELAAIAILAGMYVYLLLRWSSLPDKIPGHYNFAGEIDRWGKKGELIFIPVISTFLYGLLTLITMIPSTWNLPGKITDHNREQVYRLARNLLLFMKIEILGIFFYLNYNGMEARPLTPYFTPVFILTILGSMIYFIVRIVRLTTKKYRY